MKVYYLGPPKTFSEKAAANLASSLGPSVELVPESNFQKIALSTGTNGPNVFGVFPYYNFLEGLIQESLDLIYEHSLSICGACRIPIEFAIGGAMSQLTQAPVYSHPKALAQCSDFLMDQLPNALINPVSSTAEAARQVRESERGLAIASRDALLEHGLHILTEDIGNRRQGRQNFTDFLYASPNIPSIAPLCTDSFRVMVVITPRLERVGLLAEILAQFAFYELNVAKIHSRPAIDLVQIDIEPQMFYLEVVARPDSESLRRCSDALNYHFGNDAVRILGFFPSL